MDNIEGELAAGVVGVGSMGKHHARVYNELPGVHLAAVADEDERRAADVAAQYDTDALSREATIARCDVISIAVPTRHHYRVADEAIAADVDVLVEKPFVTDIDAGRDLIEQASDRGVVLQVGHIERFNPAIRALGDIVPDLDVIAVDVRRLGPPVDRDTTDNVVRDLMIHDIDVVLATLGDRVTDVSAISARDQRHVTAHLEFESGIVANLTASRVTQEKVRDLAITARQCRVNVDYEGQSVQIHRHSLPEYYEADGDLRYRHESIIERPTIDRGEPLRAELESFVEAAGSGTTPQVTGEDGLEALRVVRRIEEQATAENRVVTN